MKNRLDSLENFFKKLIGTTADQLRIEFKQDLRNLNIKFEEHKIWTIREMNIIIKVAQILNAN